MTYRCETVELDPDASRFADVVERASWASQVAKTVTEAETRWIDKVIERARARRERSAK